MPATVVNLTRHVSDWHSEFNSGYQTSLYSSHMVVLLEHDDNTASTVSIKDNRFCEVFLAHICRVNIPKRRLLCITHLFVIWPCKPKLIWKWYQNQLPDKRIPQIANCCLGLFCDFTSHINMSRSKCVHNPENLTIFWWFLFKSFVLGKISYQVYKICICTIQHI